MHIQVRDLGEVLAQCKYMWDAIIIPRKDKSDLFNWLNGMYLLLGSLDFQVGYDR